MATLKEVSKRTIEDVRQGRHREAYALFLVGVALVVLGLAGIADVSVLLSAILLGLSFLVFHTASEAAERRPALDQVLLSRQDFGAFNALLDEARDLRIYGPTAANVLRNSADIRRFLLRRGGTVRVIVQAEDPVLLDQTAIQLDDNFDLGPTLRSSIATMDRLATAPGFSYRLLAVNPGFSLVVVNADEARGYVIFESHGFKDEDINDRMHIVIRRHESPRWFSYWVERFDAMWAAASPPTTSLPLACWSG